MSKELPNRSFEKKRGVVPRRAEAYSGPIEARRCAAKFDASDGSTVGDIVSNEEVITGEG